MSAEIEELEKLSVLGRSALLGLKLNITVDDESFIGEVYFYDEEKNLLILRRRP